MSTALKSKGADDAGLVERLIEGLVACHDLPDPLPADPMPVLSAWFDEARRSERYEDYNAMTLATATPDGVPAARIVLCKAVEPDRPALVFYTSYASRKGRELEDNPRAAAVFHWPHAKRQARIEGIVERTTDEESDRYFSTRPLLARIGASVSPQSREIASRRSVIADAMAAARRAAAGEEVRRPAHWGGYRILPTRVELWSARTGRLHDRAVWSREEGPGPARWKAVRLGA